MRITLIIPFVILLIAGSACSKKPIPVVEERESPVMAGEGLVKLVEAVRPDFLFGAFADGININSPDKTRLRDLFRKEFGIITIGVYMKSLQPQPGTYTFGNIDDLVQFAQWNNIVIYMHPLIGGSQYTADWVNNGNFTAGELKQIMRERIDTVLSRYANKTKYVDVVNEAIIGSDNSGNTIWTTNNHVWLNMGWHDDEKGKWPLYLEEAFRIAREIGGSIVKLIYNDNSNEMMESPKALATLKLYKNFKSAGIPIDGIGMQFHCTVANGQLREGSSGKGIPVDFDSFSRNMRRFAEAGVELHITEFDVHLPENPSAADYSLQAKAYAEVLKRCIEEPACKSFKSWGFTDKYAWRPFVYNSHQLMFDEFFNQKKAYDEMRKMLEEKIRAIVP